MNQQDFLHKVKSLNVWKRGGERAPHKPLLLLLALGKIQNGEETLSYEEVDEKLRRLLEEFGPARKSYHPEFPFWYLRTDGIWEIQEADTLKSRSGKTQPTRKELLNKNATGSFPADLRKLLKRKPELIREAASIILEAYFPETLHSDLLLETGLDVIHETVIRRKRDSAFREKVLTAYEYRCGICGFDMRLGSKSIGLEAAHVKWHQAKGPDDVTNGISMCVLHHKLFDFGGFTLHDDYSLVLSEKMNGNAGFRDQLLPFHGKKLLPPQSKALLPHQIYIEWHRKEVFKGPERPF